MLRFDIEMGPGAGWSAIVIDTGDRQLELICNSDYVDSLGDLLRAFARLTTDEGTAIEVHCYEEPGSASIKLRRRRDELSVVVQRFSWDGDGVPSKRLDRAYRKNRAIDWNKLNKSRNKKAALREMTSFQAAAESLLDAFDRVERDLGPIQYERAWEFPWPTAALGILRQYLDAPS